MVQLRLHPRREQRTLLAACTTSRPAPAAYLGRRGDRDRPVGFADVAAMPEPEWATADRAGRYTVAGLVPAGQLVAVPLSAEPEPELADWERELLALPEGEPDPTAERVFADMDATADAVDAWYAEHEYASFAPGLRVVHNATGATGTVVRVTLDRAVVRLDRAPEGLTPISFFALSPEPRPARVLDDIDTVTADIAAAFAARPELVHDHVVLMSLAPVVAMLKEARL